MRGSRRSPELDAVRVSGQPRALADYYQEVGPLGVVRVSGGWCRMYCHFARQETTLRWRLCPP
jgi:hypothetical protein